MAEASAVFRQFAAAINRHDIEALRSLMSGDHAFTDPMGTRTCGAATMETAWRAYFAMCPDYWIRAGLVLADDQTVLAAGEAGGTIDGTPWRIPAAWKAVVRDGLVAEFQVFADNLPVREILARRAAAAGFDA